MKILYLILRKLTWILEAGSLLWLGLVLVDNKAKLGGNAGNTGLKKHRAMHTEAVLLMWLP